MWWTIAAGILSLALDASDSYRKAAAHGFFARDCLEKILAAVDLARLLIVKEAPETRLAGLGKEVMVLTARISEYDRLAADRDWLRATLKDAEHLMRAFEAEMDALDLDSHNGLEYAAKVFALYAVLVPLRITALVEYSAVCGGEEETQPVLDSACQYADRLTRALGRKSDAQFSPDFITRRGERTGMGKYVTQYGFTCKGSFEPVGEARPEENPQAVINRARARLQLRKEVARKAYPGAAPVLQMREYIKNCGEEA